MKTPHLFICAVIVANLAAAASPMIDVEVRFIEVSETASAPAGISWQLDGSGTTTLAAGNVTNSRSSAPGKSLPISRSATDQPLSSAA